MLHRSLKNPFYILTIVAFGIVSLFFVSCNNEDDIESIFSGKTWYITGATINGRSIGGDDIKELYLVNQSYMLYFSSDNSFSGVICPDSYVSGRWSADGHNNKINLDFNKYDNVNNTVLSTNIFNILKSSQSYSGDINNLIIKNNSENYVRFSSNKITR